MGNYKLVNVPGAVDSAIPINAVYAPAVCVYVFQDGDKFCAVREDFINLQESNHGFGKTPNAAIDNLIENEGQLAASAAPENAQGVDTAKNSEDEGECIPEPANESLEAIPTEEIAEENIQDEDDAAIEKMIEESTPDHTTCDAKHAECEVVDDCKEHHKSEAEHRVNQGG